ncbi:MAG: prepilin-type N-terminal cleavage/methylation domain-containing protein [Actinomycetota bacterium]|nr:prepilin-type N-terminal cleavage/methylation domain-containing protein [Actinomycetota bacterium]
MSRDLDDRPRPAVAVRVARSTAALRSRRRQGRGPGCRRRGDDGLTLIELAVALMVMGIFMVMVVPIVDTFVSTSARVTSTYDGFDQVLPIGTIIQQYVRAAVEPAPPLPTTVSDSSSYPVPVPVPAFGAATFQNSSGGTAGYTSATQEALSRLTGCSISFYSNVGSSLGPALITGSVAPASPTVVGAPCTSAAPASAVWVVTISETLPTAGTCPISQNGTPPSPPSTCAYSSSATKYPVTVDDVVNDLDSASAGYTPIFSYDFVSPFPPQTGVTPTETPVATSALATDFSSCTESACDAAAINQVGTDIQVRLPHGQETEDSTSVYTLSPISNEYLLSVG